MKPLSEQDYYEVLEVSRKATGDELARAYHLVSQTYQEDSLAGYSLFESGDSEAVRERIDLAWRVLSDADSRHSYDASLKPTGEVVPEVEAEWEPPEGAIALPIEVAMALPLGPALESIEEFEEEGGEYGGARLRRSRLRRGLEIDDVSRQTKVNPTYLKFIEAERFADLPARVYVRGFVMSFASCVGLDPDSVARSYLQRFDEAKPQQSRWYTNGG